MIDMLKNKLGNVLENESMSKHTTFKIGGPARYFYEAKNSADLLKAVKAAEELKIPYYILGWGSNVLVADTGYDGLIIKITSDNFEIRGKKIWAEAGVNLSRLVGLANNAGLSGLESLIGVPGTLGGAVRGNAGAYGCSLGDLVEEVEIYFQGKIEKWDHSQMHYGYRESILKTKPGVILSVLLKLKKSDSITTQTQALQIIKTRTGRFPYEPSAGCVFKNVNLREVEIDKAKVMKGLDINEAEWLEVTKHGKLSSGYILERLGLKGKKMGGCQISEKHAAFFINIGQAKAEHVIMLVSDAKMHVRNELGIQLQEEIQYLGF